MALLELSIRTVAILSLILAAACTDRPRRGEPKAEQLMPEPQGSAKQRPYALPGLEHGLLQSPVNILTNRAEGGQHEVAFNLHHAEPQYLENKGHTIEIDFASGSTIEFDGREYALEQLHFHTPSEHQIDGVTYPMEAHVVNMMEPDDPDEPPFYLVVSFLFRMGEEDPFIARFLDEVPVEPGREKLKPGQVYLSPNDRNPDYEYYHYRGSLTTPPYTETVEWLIVKQIQQASPEQIRRINLIEGDNARHVQALYGRPIEH